MRTWRGRAVFEHGRPGAEVKSRDSRTRNCDRLAAALRALGNTTLIKEDTRAMWGWTRLEHLVQDMRYAIRAARKSPGFTTVAILSLTLGIGANTAIFTFVNAALLKPLPYPDADRIVALEQRPLTSQMRTMVSTPTTLVHPRSFVPWHDRSQSFDALAIAQPVPVNTQDIDGTAEQAPGLWTTPELFRVFGVAPILGRVFTDQEGFGRGQARGEAAGTSVVVLSYGYWQPMEQCVSTALARPRLYAVLLGTFASLALLLAAVGLYGILAYAVSRRTHEIGVRMALGARPHDVLRSMLGQGTRLVLAGLALGLACAIALSRLVANLLYGVTTRDVATYGAVVTLLGIVLLVATYIPARRASRVDPMVALRYE